MQVYSPIICCAIMGILQINTAIYHAKNQELGVAYLSALLGLFLIGVSAYAIL